MAAGVPQRTPDRARDLVAALRTPALAQFLPALQAVWEDGDLTDEEIASLRDQVRAMQDLDPACRRALELWLDPEQPPAAEDLQALRACEAAAGSGAESATGTGRLALPANGDAVAAGAQPADDAAAEAGPERALLADLVRGIGHVGRGTLRRVLQVAPVPAAAPTGPPETVAQPLRFSPSDLEGLLQPDHHDVRAQVRDLLLRLDVHADRPADRDAYRDQVLAWCRALADAGIGALAFPPQHGGRGDLGAFIAAFETLGYGDLSLLVKFGVQFGLFGGALLRLGTERHHDRWLQAAGSLDLPGCFAMTETGHGSDVAALETVATWDPASGGFVLHTPTAAARKDYIGNAAAHGHAAVVFAQLVVASERHGVHAFVVRLRDDSGLPLPGITIEDCGAKLGLEGVDNGRVWFDRVAVPRDDLLDRFASVDADGVYRSPIASPGKRFFTMIGTLVHGRVSVATAALSASKVALTIAVRYSDRRRQFGGDAGGVETPLLDYRTHQRRLLPRLARTYALHFALRHLIARDVAVTSAGAAAGQETRELEGLAAGLKAITTWHATDTIQQCREACGGQGYLAVNRFAALKADTEVFTTFEGDNTVLLQLVAKGLLTGYRQQFSDLNVFALVRLLAGRTLSTIAESNPLGGTSTDEGHLRDRAFHLGLFRWREEHVLDGLGRRLKALIDAGTDPQHAFGAVQDHAVTAARVAMERVVLEQFATAVDGCADPDLQRVLAAVCDLYALSHIEADRGWFLEHGQLAPSKSKAIQRLVNEVCAELRPHAVGLVDAFGIPDGLVAAPIALAADETPRG